MNFLTDRKHVLVALAVLGDAMVFVLLVILAPVEHGSVQIEAFGRTALPFAGRLVPGVALAGHISRLHADQLAHGRLANPPRLAGLWNRAVVLRVWLTDRTFSWAFTIASIALVAAMLPAWRVVLILAAGRIERD